jgi:hypothetical protein
MRMQAAVAMVLVSSVLGCGGGADRAESVPLKPPLVSSLPEQAMFYVRDTCIVGLACEPIDGLMLGTYVVGSFSRLGKDPPYSVRSSDPAILDAVTTSWRPADPRGYLSQLTFRLTAKAVGEARLEVVGGSGRVEGWQVIAVRMPDSVEPVVRVPVRSQGGAVSLSAASRSADGAWQVQAGDEVHLHATARFQGRRLIQGTGVEFFVPESAALAPAGLDRWSFAEAGTPVLVGKSPGETQIAASVGSVQGTAIVRVR